MALGKKYDRQVIEEFLNKGADINSKSSIHGTPLMVAARHGDEEFVKQLLAKGSDVNATYLATQPVSVCPGPKVDLV